MEFIHICLKQVLLLSKYFKPYTPYSWLKKEIFEWEQCFVFEFKKLILK